MGKKFKNPWRPKSTVFHNSVTFGFMCYCLCGRAHKRWWLTVTVSSFSTVSRVRLTTEVANTLTRKKTYFYPSLYIYLLCHLSLFISFWFYLKMRGHLLYTATYFLLKSVVFSNPHFLRAVVLLEIWFISLVDIKTMLLICGFDTPDQRALIMYFPTAV